MIVEKRSFTPNLPDQISCEVTEKTLFFDIETTGFSPKTSHLYMIGCCYMDSFGFHTIQWFDDQKTNESEKELLISFIEFIPDFDCCISFNGTTFDFPYIQKKCAAYHLADPFGHLDHIDIYKKLKPYRDFIGLSDLKQKSVEAFLGISREDQYSGGQLIPVYDAYIRSKSLHLYRQLIQHNYDDLCGMISLLPIISYIRLFEGQFSFQSSTYTVDCLTLHFTLNNFILIPVFRQTAIFTVDVSEFSMIMKIPVLHDTLKYFYKNPKDYYYLPLEDTAIHKSIAAFVDKEYRQKATKENCYIKKEGFFLPQPKLVFKPEYRSAAASKSYYFTWDTISENPDDICLYARVLLGSICTGE